MVHGKCHTGIVRLKCEAVPRSSSLSWALCGGRNTSHFTLGAKSRGTGSTVFGGGETMAAKLEVVVDAGVSGQETLRLAG